ncbi:MAG TPA: hypothetical protein VFU41_00695 [Gemmatimonadales bacterium]|nr:hypothetical protein [Gemmatimonadales bacterium]
MRCLAAVVCIAAMSAQAGEAQEPVAPPAESTRSESTAVPAVPTPEQQRFLDGLRTATRGVAQLKDGLGRMSRAQATRDSVARRRAGRFLAGLCGSARGFLARGRRQMNPTAYEDSTLLLARRLTARIDSLIAYTPTCERDAVALPDATATELTKRMKVYDTAFRDFRAAIGLPVREDTAKTGRR